MLPHFFFSLAFISPRSLSFEEIFMTWFLRFVLNFSFTVCFDCRVGKYTLKKTLYSLFYAIVTALILCDQNDL